MSSEGYLTYNIRHTCPNASYTLFVHMNPRVYTEERK